MDSPVAVLLTHAILILAAWALISDVIKDLYEQKIVRAGLPPEDITVPFLESTAASELRRFVRLFARRLFYFYAFLAVLVLLFEYAIVPDDMKISIEVHGWRHDWILEKMVVSITTTLHVIIVLMVAWIAFRITQIRDDEARLRWRAPA